ncbi:MAG TPA: acyltransferase [Terrimicrobiaceae bacterium]
MKSDRNILIDATKLLLAFTVVFMHLVPNRPELELIGRPLLTFTVPFFWTIALYFFIRKIKKSPELNFRDLNFERLILPYFAWTVIYLLLRLVKYRSHMGDFEPGSPIEIAFYGGATLHLYFLPFLLLCEALIISFVLISGTLRQSLIGILVFVGVFIFTYIGDFHRFFGFELAFMKSLLYVAVAYLLYTLQTSNKYVGINAAIAGVIFVILLATAFGEWPDWLFFMRGPLAGYSLGSLVLAWRPQVKPSQALKYLLGYSFGIYLTHLVFMAGFEWSVKRLGLQLTPYSFFTKLPITFLICGCCILFIALVRKNPLARLILLGESTGTRRAAAAEQPVAVQSSNWRSETSKLVRPSTCETSNHLTAVVCGQVSIPRSGVPLALTSLAASAK